MALDDDVSRDECSERVHAVSILFGSLGWMKLMRFGLGLFEVSIDSERYRQEWETELVQVPIPVWVWLGSVA